MIRLIISFCFFFGLLCLWTASFAQVKDDTPTESNNKMSKGFFTASIGVNPLGYSFSSISYNHYIGVGYLGVEFGSMVGDDGAYTYVYAPLLLSYTSVAKPKGKGRFLGYGSIKVGQANFISATPLEPLNPFLLAPLEDNLLLFGIHGGVQARLTNHLFLHTELGLSNIYSFIVGVTIKL